MRCLAVISLGFLLLSGYSCQLSAQEVSQSKPVLGVRYTASYHILKSWTKKDYFKVMSSVPAVFIEYNKHLDFHIGIVYAHMFNPWINYFVFKPDAAGLMAGCRLTSVDYVKNIRLVGQIDESVINTKYIHSDTHYNRSELLSRMIWISNLSLGADYQLNDKFHLNAGFSCGITFVNYFDFHKVFPSFFLGADYRFGHLKKK